MEPNPNQWIMCYQNEQKENVTFGEEGEVGRERRLEKSATPNDALKKIL